MDNPKEHTYRVIYSAEEIDESNEIELEMIILDRQRGGKLPIVKRGVVWIFESMKETCVAAP